MGSQTERYISNIFSTRRISRGSAVLCRRTAHSSWHTKWCELSHEHTLYGVLLRQSGISNLLKNEMLVYNQHITTLSPKSAGQRVLAASSTEQLHVDVQELNLTTVIVSTRGVPARACCRTRATHRRTRVGRSPLSYTHTSSHQKNGCGMSGHRCFQSLRARDVSRVTKSALVAIQRENAACLCTCVAHCSAANLF